jgi:hypothetical protein
VVVAEEEMARDWMRWDADGSGKEGPEQYEARDQKDKMELCMYLNSINLVLILLLGILSSCTSYILLYFSFKLNMPISA